MIWREHLFYALANCHISTFLICILHMVKYSEGSSNVKFFASISRPYILNPFCPNHYPFYAGRFIIDDLCRASQAVTVLLRLLL